MPREQDYAQEYAQKWPAAALGCMCPGGTHTRHPKGKSDRREKPLHCHASENGSENAARATGLQTVIPAI